jgi:hypothetical protein
MIMKIKELRECQRERDRPGRFQSASRRLALEFRLQHNSCFGIDPHSNAFGGTPKAADETSALPCKREPLALFDQSATPTLFYVR